MVDPFFEAERILGISRSANLTRDMVESFYHAKVMSTHPDLGGDHEEFIKIEEARKVLLDEIIKIESIVLIEEKTEFLPDAKKEKETLTNDVLYSIFMSNMRNGNYDSGEED